MTKKKKQKLKVMVSSTVYHFKNEIEQICSTLMGFGYDVLCSHIGTIYPVNGNGTEEACLAAVEECDFFLGIILPQYGSGITHKEFKKAIELDKPRAFLAHQNVTFARQLLSQFMYDDQGNRTDFKLTKKTAVKDDLRVIEMYNEAVEVAGDPGKRLWAQDFSKYSLDGSRFVERIFSDPDRLRTSIEQQKIKK